jgi:hypothetical protein
MVHRRCYRHIVRWATLVLLTLVGCNDLRDFRGPWRGSRIGVDGSALRVGLGTTAALSIDQIDAHGLRARLAVEGLLPETEITSLPGAEADVLAGITFSGAPLRVYLAFAPVPDGGGEALVVVALYDDRRVEVRLMRGSAPLYGIFALTELEPVTLRDSPIGGARTVP